MASKYTSDRGKVDNKPVPGSGTLLSSRPVNKPSHFSFDIPNPSKDDESGYSLSYGSSSSTTSFSTHSNEFVPLSSISHDSVRRHNVLPSISSQWSSSSDSRSVVSDVSSVVSGYTSTSGSRTVSSDKYLNISASNGSSKRNHKSSNIVQLDRLDTAFSSTSKLRHTPSTTLRNAAISSTSPKNIVWSEVNPKANEPHIAPLSPSSSSEARTPSPANDIRSRTSALFMKTLGVSKTTIRTKIRTQSSPPESPSPSNRLPSLGFSSSAYPLIDVSKSSPRNSSPGRKALPERKVQKVSPNSKPRPLSTRMSTLISIFSNRTDSTADPLIAVVETPLEPPKSTLREAKSASMAGRRASSRPNTKSRRSSLAGSPARTSTSSGSPRSGTPTYTVRNLDTGQVIDMNRFERDVPSTISPRVVFKSLPPGPYYDMPPLLGKLNENADSCGVRSL